MELGFNYQKKINELFKELATLFKNTSYKLPAFIDSMCNNERIIWHKGEPFHFVHGNETVFKCARNKYENNTYEEVISIGNAIFNPYDVFCLYRRQNRLFYSDKNIAFVLGNTLIQWDASDDALNLFIKNNNEDFKLSDGFYADSRFLKAKSYGDHFYKSDMLLEKKDASKNVYDFLTVIYNEFKLFTLK